VAFHAYGWCPSHTVSADRCGVMMLLGGEEYERLMPFSEQLQGFNYVGVRSRILAGDIVERHSQIYRIDVWGHQIIKMRGYFEQRTGSESMRRPSTTAKICCELYVRGAE